MGPPPLQARVAQVAAGRYHSAAVADVGQGEFARGAREEWGLNEPLQLVNSF